MTTDQSSAADKAREAAEGGPAERFVERLVDRIGGRAGVQAVFGEPIQRGDMIVVPVARVRWGFGGGSGSAGLADGEPGSGSGSGGGGGVGTEPVGYLAIGPDGARFERIVQPYPSPMFLLASGVTAAIIIRALARLVRG
jgi:uncharacterized spore protein YtfJ